MRNSGMQYVTEHHNLDRKNLKIQQMKFGRENDPEDKSVSSDDDEKDEATKS